MSRFFLIGLVFMSGCWNTDFQEPGRIEVPRKSTEGVINQPFTRAWAATQVTLGKFPMLRKDADVTTGRGYVVTDWIRGKSDSLYHGYDLNRVPYVIRYKLTIFVNGDPRVGRTKISIKSVEQYLDDAVTSGVDVQGGLYTWIKTESSSLKENSLLEQINKLAMDPEFKPLN